MNSFFPSFRSVQVRNLQHVVKDAEVQMGELCCLLASYTRATAKLRDKADRLVAQLFDISNTENAEIQVGLKTLADDLAMVQDYRQAEIERLETKVVAPLKAYGAIIKSKKAEMKRFNTDLNRELKELQKLENIRLRNPADRQTISKAQVNARKASSNAKHSIRNMEESILGFQDQKLQDIKMIFMEFIRVEMLFHAKALEVYSHTYHNLEVMNTGTGTHHQEKRVACHLQIGDESLPQVEENSFSLLNERTLNTFAGHVDIALSRHSSFLSHYSSPLESPTGQSIRRHYH
ncbi:CBY1-interacting BAR domain-containing protein 2-like [Dunckerocampus dactyliophorus]|uniref:CBY1-interacting BAR domain-containing protein 2-like n=1 Tax=Dunckerocampus dactyliophorus TaxID=161453 RepID=UPI0024055A74|nr:CBY1-interacting BAR domain-containing protein 2-like [Dunckerocampus dactyliophorus]